MGKSPGKWIKSVLFGKKSSRSSSTKAKDKGFGVVGIVIQYMLLDRMNRMLQVRHGLKPLWINLILITLLERKEALEGFLGTPLPSHPKLIRDQLKNGLRYLILPNKVSANRILMEPYI